MQKDYISIFCRTALSHPHVPAVNLFNAFIDSGDDEQKRFAEKNMVLLIRCAEAARSFECEHGRKGNEKKKGGDL